MLRALFAEFLGTAFLLVGVVGSGIMAADLAGGNIGLALLANAIATGCVLYVIITVLGPISGAHFNPAVTIAFALTKEMPWHQVPGYILVQVFGGILGVWAAHFMFDLSIIQTSSTVRSGISQFASEVVATFGLLFVIFGGIRTRRDAVATLVALYITGAYWFTSSTSFANPAVTIGRAFTDTFAGIMPQNVAMFVFAQLVGVAIAVPVHRWLFDE